MGLDYNKLQLAFTDTVAISKLSDFVMSDIIKETTMNFSTGSTGITQTSTSRNTIYLVYIRVLCLVDLEVTPVSIYRSLVKKSRSLSRLV